MLSAKGKVVGRTLTLGRSLMVLPMMDSKDEMSVESPRVGLIAV